MMAYAQSGWACPGYGASGGYGLWGVGIGALLWILVVTAIIVFAVWAIRRGTHHTVAPTTASGDPHAIGVVRERYARGELDRDEYQRLIDDLR